MIKTIRFLILASLAFNVFATDKVQVLPLPADVSVKPLLPDYSVHTPSSVRAQISLPTAKAKVLVNRLDESKRYLRSVYSENFLIFAKKQKQLPQGVIIQDGAITLQELSDLLPNTLIRKDSGAILARLPIIIETGAALHLEPKDNLQLSAERGVFLHNNGILVIDSANVEGWLESTNSRSLYSGDDKQFRPFILSYGGSQSYFISSSFHALGYKSGGSYGLSLKGAAPEYLASITEQERAKIGMPPTGYIVDSEFRDIYYGFYCFEAKDVVIASNRYYDNIVYGIDPHDFSTNLLIAANTVIGTKVRHGIIVSRHVNDSFIINNVTHGNNRTGIMVDRESKNNIVAFNEVYNNKGDGITIYESSDNLIYGNRVYNNLEHGVRVRNSIGIQIFQNIVLNNQGAGVYFHTRDLSYQTYRDLNLDPYTMDSSGAVIGGLIAYNRNGAIFSEGASTLVLGQLRMESNGNEPYRGELHTHTAAITLATWERDKAVRISFEKYRASDNDE